MMSTTTATTNNNNQTNTNTNTDVNKLRHSLEEAGYLASDANSKDSLNTILQQGGPIVPLLKNLLSDLQSTSRSNSDLMKYYDELYDKWKEAAAAAGNRVSPNNTNNTNLPPTSNPSLKLDQHNNENDPFDLSALLDSSLLSNISLTTLQNEIGKKNEEQVSMEDFGNYDDHYDIIGETFILSSVEKAQERITQLEAELATLKRNGGGTTTATATTATSTKNEVSLRKALKEKQEECEKLRSNLHDQRTKTDSAIKSLNSKSDDLSIDLLRKLQTLTLTLPTPSQHSLSAKAESVAILLKGGGGGGAGLLDFLDMLSGSLKENQEYLTKVSLSKQEILKKREKELEEASKASLLLKQGNQAFQSQIANLTKVINQKEWEQSVHVDLSSQISILKETLSSLEERSERLDRIQNDLLNTASSVVSAGNVMATDALHINPPSSTATLQSLRVMLEAMSTQLHTDLSFGVHLTNVVEKLNIRRNESEAEIQRLQEALTVNVQRENELQSSILTTSLKMEAMQEKVAQVEREEKVLLGTIDALKDNIKVSLRNLDLFKKASTEAKQAKESYEAVIGGMKRNEEMIKGHVKGQDEEISRLRDALSSLSGDFNSSGGLSDGGLSTNNSTNTKVPTSPQLTQLIKDEASLSAKLKEKEAELERAQRDIIEVREEAKAAKEILDGRKKERDLLMTTYCKVIKDNERLTFELEELRNAYNPPATKEQEGTIRAFDQRLKIQSEEMEALRMRVARAESHARAEEAKSRLLKEQLHKWETEAFQREKELLGVKGKHSSLEQNKRDLAAQLQRFSQQAKELRDEVRRVEGERAMLERRLQSSEGQHPSSSTTSSSSSSSSSGNEVRLLTNELSKTKDRIANLLKEKEDLNSMLRGNSEQLEFLKQQIRIERKKREEGEGILRSVKGAGGELKEQLNLLAKEHDLEHVKRRIGNVRRIAADETVLSSDLDEYVGDNHSDHGDHHSGHSDNHGDNHSEQQSFSNVPGQAWRSLRRLFRSDGGEDGNGDGVNGHGNGSGKHNNQRTDDQHARTDGHHRQHQQSIDDNYLLRMENRKLREDLMGIREEIKDNMSSDITAATNSQADLDTSITEIDDLLSADSVGDSDDVGGSDGGSGGGLDRVSLIKRRLERENRALMNIVDRVKGDLLSNNK